MTTRRLVLVFALVALAVALWTAVAHGQAPTPEEKSLATQETQLAAMKDNLHITMARVDLDWEYVQYDGNTGPTHELAAAKAFTRLTSSATALVPAIPVTVVVFDG
jgi:hypothetical protein